MSEIDARLQMINDLMKRCVEEDKRFGNDGRLANDLYCLAVKEAEKIGPGMRETVRDMRFGRGGFDDGGYPSFR
ncbi:MAG: hypothetical protein WCO09_01610 [bacterium]